MRQELPGACKYDLEPAISERAAMDNIWPSP